MKNKLKIVLSLVFTAFFFLSCTFTKVEEKERTITVPGSASIELESDVEIVTFTVTTSGWSAKLIVQDNNTISERFISAVKTVGVSEADIRSTECVITNPNNYESKRDIIITVRNKSLLPAIVDCKTGSIRLKSVKFDTLDTGSEKRRVRTLALQNAQDAAGLLAGASGSKLGEVIKIVSEDIEETKTDDHKLILTSKVTISYDLQ